jgi:hypothetical protein
MPGYRPSGPEKCKRLSHGTKDEHPVMRPLLARKWNTKPVSLPAAGSERSCRLGSWLLAPPLGKLNRNVLDGFGREGLAGLLPKRYTQTLDS